MTRSSTAQAVARLLQTRHIPARTHKASRAQGMQWTRRKRKRGLNERKENGSAVAGPAGRERPGRLAPPPVAPLVALSENGAGYAG